jgi:hypothetical protein
MFRKSLVFISYQYIIVLNILRGRRISPLHLCGEIKVIIIKSMAMALLCTLALFSMEPSAFVQTALAQTGDSAPPQRPAEADGPLAQAIAHAADNKPERSQYSYQHHLVMVAKDKKTDRRTRFDPRQPDGAHWELLAVDGAAPSAEDLADYKQPDLGSGKSSDSFALYGEMIAKLDWQDATLVSINDREAHYRIEGQLDQWLDAESAAFAEHLKSDLVVDLSSDAPFVSSMRIFAPAPFSKPMVAKIKAFETLFTFNRHAKSGDILPQSIEIGVSLKALMFFSVDSQTDISFSDFVYLGSEIL